MAKLSLLLALKSDSEELRLNYCSFSLLKVIAECVLLLFANAFKSVKERRKAITLWKAIQKRSHEPIYKTYTKNEAKGLRATTLLSQSWKSYN
jgi:hypothetical protein